jgi:hypothetical protein
MRRCYSCWQEYKRLDDEFPSYERKQYKPKSPPAPRVIYQLVEPPEYKELLTRAKQLMSMCNPDKHGNTESANEMMHWLIAVHKKAKRMTP